MDPQPASVVPPATPSQRHTTMAILIVVVIIALGVMGFAYYHHYYQLNSSTANSSTTASSSVALLNEAHNDELKGNWSAAEAEYNAALKATPNTFAPYMGLGRIDTATGSTTLAIGRFRAAYEYAATSTEQSQAAYSVGMLLFASGDVDAAQGFLQAAVSLDPTYPFAQLGLGTILYALSLKNGITSSAEAQLKANSAAAMSTGALLLGFASPQSALQSPYAEDLYVVGNPPDLMLAALGAATTAVSNDASRAATDKTTMLDILGNVKLFITQGPPISPTP